jgi:hypothetical protein
MMARVLAVGLAAVPWIALAPDLLGQMPGRGAPIRRAAVPEQSWDAATSALFAPDAFALLPREPRPQPQAEPSAGRASLPSGATESDPGRPVHAEAFPWSTLVSEETLTDEVKDMREVVAAASASTSSFRGGGSEAARDAFGSLAVCFGVVAEYDGDVRWRAHAEAARDLFARAGFNCAAGSDQALAEARARLEDLTNLLAGSPPEGQPDRSEDFFWHQLTDRARLMRRVARAEQAVLEATAAQADFDRRREPLRQAAEIIALLGEVIQRPNFPDHDDETYREFSAAMRDAAAAVRAAVDDRDYEAARAAVGRLRGSCTDCHGSYRG